MNFVNLHRLVPAVICISVVYGCHSHDLLKPEALSSGIIDSCISSVDMKDGRTIYFDRDESGYATFRDSTVSRTHPDGTRESYPLNQIAQIHRVRPSSTGDKIAIAIALGLACFISALISFGPFGWRGF